MISYSDVCQGRFLARPNRFIALVELEGQAQRCHVPNTGRLGELLLPGARVWCQRHREPGRKTGWTLISVEKDGAVVNLDSQAPNRLAFAYVRDGGLGFLPDTVRAEQPFGDARLDLAYEVGGRRGYVEVKGVTLNEGGVARFPDAPTQRGAKHLLALTQAVAAGHRAAVLFVAQMDTVTRFQPNWPRDPAFARGLVEAARAGVAVLAVRCAVTPDTIAVTVPLEVDLSPWQRSED